jgi:pantoate--beta-alanine ligase
MITVERIAEVRALCDEARAAGRSVGFVPTMGAFHDGHASLMRGARDAHDLVVVSLFVNPTQFAPGEDLEAYPRDLDGDARIASASGVDVLFTPSTEEMYPRPMLTTVLVSELTDVLCGASRPGHFSGVATVVTKLFSIVGRCTAYFGNKDYQQVAIVRRLVADLDLPVAIVGCPIVRDADGVAMSSRNQYLTADERRAAPVLVNALRHGAEVLATGVRDVDAVRKAVARVVDGEPLATLDYAEIVRADDLAPVGHIQDGEKLLVALAAYIGKARLIDNTTAVVNGRSVTTELPALAPTRERGNRCTAR